MEGLAPSEVFLFEDFRLDRRGGGLFRCDDSGVLAPIAIGSRGLDILGVLIARAGEVVSKDEIIAAVWPGTVVEDSNLTVQISALRRVLDRGPAQGRCIQTVSGRGYRFAAAVTRPLARGSPGASSIGDTAAVPTEDAQSAAAPVPSFRSGLSRLRPWRRLLDFIPVPAVIGDRRRLGITSPPRLSLVVLPFSSFSNQPAQRDFADRLTDDLTTDLSRFTGMLVISRSTAFTYRNRPVDAKQIGRELRVRFALEGSVQHLANHVRVNVQLIDTRRDVHLWAERFDRDPEDLVGVQDEIVRRTAVALYQALIAVEVSRPSDHPDALDYVLRGRTAQFKSFGPDTYAEAISLFDRAFALDPQSEQAQGWLADTLARRVLDEMTDTAAADISRAAGLAAQALATSPRSAFSHSAQGQVLCAQSRYKEAIAEFETASAINPGWPHLYGFLSDCKLWTGSIADAIPLAELAIRISPMIPGWPLGIPKSGGCTWCNRALMRRSLGSKRHGALICNFQPFTPCSPPPMPSRGKSKAPALNWRKHGG